MGNGRDALPPYPKGLPVDPERHFMWHQPEERFGVTNLPSDFRGLKRSREVRTEVGVLCNECQLELFARGGRFYGPGARHILQEDSDVALPDQPRGTENRKETRGVAGLGSRRKVMPLSASEHAKYYLS